MQNTIQTDVARAIRVTIPAFDLDEQPIAPRFKGLLTRHFFPEPQSVRSAEDEARIRGLRAVMLDAEIEWENRQYHRANCPACFGKDSTPFEVLAWTCPSRGVNR